MDQKTQQNEPNIQINAQYIKDLSFEAPGLPHILTEIKAQPKINVNVDVNVAKTDNDTVFTIDLTTKIAAQTADSGKAIFVGELVYGAMATINAPAEHHEYILLVEIPRLLFPFVRSIISNTTRESGLPPLQINPIDFASLYYAKKEAGEPKQ